MRHATCRRFISSAALLNSFVSIRMVTPYFDINAITWDATDCIMYCTCGVRVRIRVPRLALASFSTYETHSVSILRVDIPCRLDGSKTEHSRVYILQSVSEGAIYILICLKLQPPYRVWHSYKRWHQIHIKFNVIVSFRFHLRMKMRVKSIKPSLNKHIGFEDNLD